MRLLHLEASPGWGGQEIRILREAIGMRKRGHEVLLAVMRGAELGKRAKEKSFAVYEVNFKRLGWPKTFYQLCQIIYKHQIDLILTHSSLDSWIGGLAGRFMRKPILRTRHLSTPIKAGLNSHILYGKLADFVVTTCASILQTIRLQSGQRGQSVPTGIDPESMEELLKEPDCDKKSRDFRKEWNIGKDIFLVGTMCFMRSWKGIEDFLKAADLLRDEKNLKWLLIGGGHAEKYRALAEQLRLDQRVIFTGHLENPFAALEALDLFALLSTAHEGVSQAILQAAYLGKPLVATPTGGLCEVCIPGSTGIQVPPFSPETVAQAVLELKKSPLLRHTLGTQAKKLVKERFTWQATLDEMEKIMTQTIYNKPFKG